MRKTIRILGWLIKAVLLLIALAALVVWLPSRGRLMDLKAEKFSAGADWGEWRWYRAGGWDGRAFVAHFHLRTSELHNATALRMEADRDDSWRWRTRSKK